MVYEVTDNRILLDRYFLEMDTEHIIHVYGAGMKEIDTIPMNKALSFNEFQKFCNDFINNIKEK